MNSTLDQDVPPTALQKEFAAYLAIAANVPNATFVVLHAMVGHRFSMRLRVLGSQVLTLQECNSITGIDCVYSYSLIDDRLAKSLSSPPSLLWPL